MSNLRLSLYFLREFRHKAEVRILLGQEVTKRSVAGKILKLLLLPKKIFIPRLFNQALPRH